MIPPYGHRVPGMEWDSPPMPRDQHEAQRWAYTARRRRILYGLHRDLVEKRLADSIGMTAVTSWGGVDLSTNLARLVCDSVSALYQAPPRLLWLGERGNIATTMEELTRRLHVWSLLQRVSRDAIGLREQLVRVGYSSAGAIVVRSVRPDRVEAEAHDDDPARPVRVVEWRLRNGKWTGDVFDVSDPERPVVYVIDERRELLGEVLAEGDGYLWRTPEGDPILPFVWYRAAQTDGLWDPYEWDSLFEGTLHASVLRSLYCHIVQTSSWKQRYMLNAEAVAAASSQRGAEIEGDPALVLSLRTSPNLEPGATSSVGVLDQPSDPLQVLMSIERWEHACVGSVGLPAAELLRSAGDPRSGIALQVADQGKREVQRRFVSQLASADEQLLGLLALAGQIAGTPGFDRLPYWGWRVVHPGFEDVAGSTQTVEEATPDEIASRALASGDYNAASQALAVKAQTMTAEAQAGGQDGSGRDDAE